MISSSPDILLVASHFPPVIGGSAAVYGNLCRHLSRRVAVLAAFENYRDGQEIGGWRAWDARQTFAVFRLPLLRPRVRVPRYAAESIWRLATEDLPVRQRARRTVIRMVREMRPRAVCLGEFFSLHWLGHTLRTNLGLPVIHYIHAEDLTAGPGSRLLGRGSETSLRSAEAVVAVSNYTRNELTKRGVRPERVHVITNGVDLSRFTPGAKSADILSRHALHGKRILLTVARLEVRKGHDKVIAAMPQILKAVPEAVYLIVGDGGNLGELRRLAASAGVEKKVIFAGVATDAELLDYYRTADVFVMPNRTIRNGDTEGFGIVFLEASACGKPVIGGRDGGVPDAVTDGETGLLVDGNSVSEVAHAAIRLLSDEQLSTRLGRGGLARARRSSWDSKAEEFYRLCLNAGR